MTTTFGMEFEIQGLSPARAADVLNNAGITCNATRSTHETAEHWKAVYDGSVSSGAEVVSPILNPSRLNEAHKVTKALKDHGARVDRATGFHVHIGLNAFGNYETISKFVLNYYSMHHALAALVAPSRLNNRYCAVLPQSVAERQAEFTAQGNAGAFNGNRYTSLNLESISRHGTVEVRLHQGTLNGVKAIAWAQFIAGLIDATNKGADFTQAQNLTPWAFPTIPSVSACHGLLDALVASDSLNASTGDWLKGRATRLNG